MATVSVVKLKVRRGTDAERQQIILDEGELGYTIDSKRLFVGDAFIPGGISTGIKYYTGSITGATLDDENISTIQTGDIVLDTTTSTTALYILTGSNTSFARLSAYAKLK